MPDKRESELKREQQEALDQLDDLFHQSKPKNITDGVSSGVNTIVDGALGAVGLAVLAPATGFAAGKKKAGIVGGLVGATGGAVVGAVGGVGMMLGGAVSGAAQVVRGAVNTPKAVKSSMMDGKWWNENTCEWVLTKLDEVQVPTNDDDLLNPIKEMLDSRRTTGSASGVVKETHYYDVLDVDPKEDASAIKRQYYILARKYHPDKASEEEKEEYAGKFEEMAEAYQVLSDPQLRQLYDKMGSEALSADKTERSGPDPVILMAHLFGSEQFHDYFGRLATSTSAMLGDTTELSAKDARTLQERRCTRLALKLRQKVKPWLGKEESAWAPYWAAEATELSETSFGYELVMTLGMAYEVTAEQFLGSVDSGIGMPSIGKWASGQQAKKKKKSASRENEINALKAKLDAMQLKEDYEKKIEEATNAEDKAALQLELQQATQARMIQVIWTATVVDITSTIHETCQMLFFDRSVDKETRKQRALMVKNIGLVFQACPEPEDKDEQDINSLFEDAALAAMVETIKMKDNATFRASMIGPR